MKTKTGLLVTALAIYGYAFQHVIKMIEFMAAIALNVIIIILAVLLAWFVIGISYGINSDVNHSNDEKPPACQAVSQS